jgi:hypothetical protein
MSLLSRANERTAMPNQEPLPDGTYAEWQGSTYRASFTARPPASVRIRAEKQGEIPPGFEERKPGEISKVVPKTELTALYQLQTYCRWKGEPCRVTEWQPDGRIQLSWIRGIQSLGGELGFEMPERGVFLVTVPESQVTNLHQEREDIPLM